MSVPPCQPLAVHKPHLPLYTGTSKQAYTPQKNVPQESALLYSIVLLYLLIKGGIYTLGSS